MKKLALFTVMAAAALLAMPVASEPAFAQSGVKKEKPLRGVVRPARRGGYSYKYLQGTDTRRFVDSMYRDQTVGGPFDSGFFFWQPTPQYGGQSPYMQ